MELRKELYFRKYWKVEEILLLLSEGCESDDSGDVFDDAKGRTIYISEFEKAISEAIESGALETHKASDGDNSDYLDKNEFFVWLLASKYDRDINYFLYEVSIEFALYNGPDRTVFARAVREGGLFTLEQAFRHLAGMPATENKAHWSKEDKASFEAFEIAANGKETFNPEEIIATAKKANIHIPEEMQIPIDEAKKFSKKNLTLDKEMQSLINELHKQCPALNHKQLCDKAAILDDPRNKSKSTGVINKKTRSPKGKIVAC